VVVDAGQDPDFAPSPFDIYVRLAARFDAGNEDRLETRLREAGLDPGAARHHVFTHLHVDHVGSGPLPSARVVLNADEWAAATSRGAALRGYRPQGIRDPLTVADGHDLYGDGAIRLIATPGHTAGHQAVLVTPPEGPRVLIAGDAVYSENALLEKRIDGVGLNPGQARRSIDRLRAICRESPSVVAATHDSDSQRRVMSGQATVLPD
jgi:glyoxylase-like metal-dependent hydrolase (beta-lactamase superfamily II)